MAERKAQPDIITPRETHDSEVVSRSIALEAARILFEAANISDQPVRARLATVIEAVVRSGYVAESTEGVSVAGVETCLLKMAQKLRDVDNTSRSAMRTRMGV